MACGQLEIPRLWVRLIMRMESQTKNVLSVVLEENNAHNEIPDRTTGTMTRTYLTILYCNTSVQIKHT